GAHARLDRLEVRRRDVLRRVHAAAVDPEGAEVVEVRPDAVAHGVRTGAQVLERHQAAVLHLVAVGVVADVGAAVVEVGRAVGPGEVVVGELRPRSAGAGLPGTGHVVHHGVRDDADTGGVTGRDHGGELGAGAQLRLDPVADRLVGGPPLRASNVLHRRRHLHVPEPGRADHVAALQI